MTVTRLDTGELQKPERLPNGFLRVPASITRTGVFTYGTPGGGRVREWRPPEEVFHADSLHTLALAPVTDDHPPKLLDSSNARDFTAGSVGEVIKRDGDKVTAAMMVTDAALIAKMDSGEARQCSAGYTCDLEHTPGTTPEGERYDAIQRRIRYNHVAVLEKGRAGPEVRVRMDAADLGVILISDPQQSNPEKPNVKTIKIDGIDYPVDSDAAVQAHARFVEKMDATIATAKAEAETARKLAEQTQAKFDSADSEVKKLKAEIAEQPKRIAAEMARRVELETTARKVLGSKAKFDGLKDDELRAQVIAKLEPTAKLDGKSAEYIAARFDSALERFDADDAQEGEAGDQGERTDGGHDDDDTEERLDADDAKKKFLAATEGMWSKKIPGAVARE